MYKMVPELLDAWARVLAAVPNSRLMLFPFGPNWSNVYPKRAFVDHMVRLFERHGVDGGRLVVIDRSPPLNRQDVRELMRLADVYLDSFPFCGSTSLIEPLEAGLPVVSKRGTVLRASMAAAMLDELRMPEMIAADEGAYVELAARLGNDPAAREAARGKVGEQMAKGPRFLDSVGYGKRIGEMYRRMAEHGR